MSDTVKITTFAQMLDVMNGAHSSAEGAAKMAKDANVKKLVLSHMGKHISTHGVLENALGNAAKIFDGEIVFAEELMKISF